jgi:hypothetical protein
MSFLKNLFGGVPKENKTLLLPNAKIAEIILRFSVAVTAETAQIAEKAALMKINDVTYYALLREVFAYHLNIAIATIMVKKNLIGITNYKQIEGGLCDAVSSILKKPGANLGKYLPIISSENREKALMYSFGGDQYGLEISDEQIRAYAEKHNKKILTDIPANQMFAVYYNIRIARLLEVGRDIDKFIVWGVNTKLVDRSLEMQNEVCECLI